ncbi:MAG: alpha/beta hydrolase family protein [Nitrospiria bacterium]
MRSIVITCLLFVFGWSDVLVAEAKETRVFPSKDGLQMTADTYIMHKNKKTPLIVLFHQAGWSRGEYLEIAPRLNKLGFNCIAVDLRSGEGVNGILNETAGRAKSGGKGTRYVDALQDIEAALIYARQHYGKGKVIAWGSSYSAALVLKVAGDEPELVDGVLAFAPGEYFTRQGKPPNWIEDSAQKIESPVFITSARKEKGAWSNIFKAIKTKDKMSYLPSSQGNHGSRALWRRFEDNEGYWRAVEEFLGRHFKN